MKECLFAGPILMKYPTIVKTLLVTEAVAGEEIGVRSEDTIVVLRPLQSKES
jgi:hypothetical protein